MITIRFAGWISGKIVSLQPDTDIQKLLSNENRIQTRISVMLSSISGLVDQMTATIFRQSYMTQRPSLFTPISYYAIVFSFALIFANGWFTACDGFYGASPYWLSHMKQ